MKTKILNEKIKLIQWLSAIEDESIIRRLMEFKKSESEDWWNEISEEEKASIKKGVREADNKELEPHSEARKLYEKWL